MSDMLVRFGLDGKQVSCAVTPSTTLAALLRQHIGCGEGVCGACTLVVDGTPIRSCLMLAVQAEGCSVATIDSLPAIEGAARNEAGLTPLQSALRDHQAFQCGWCVPGLLVGTAAFLNRRKAASRREIEEHLVGHLCRCLASAGVVDALEDVLRSRGAAS